MSLAESYSVPSPPSLDLHGDSITLLHPLGGQAKTSPASGIVLDTMFNVRRGYYDPKVSLTERQDGSVPKVPPQPQPTSLGPAGILSGAEAILGGLMGTGAPTGAQIDAIRK